MKSSTNIITLLLIVGLAFGCEKELLTPAGQDTPTAHLAGSNSHIRPDQQCGSSRFSDIIDEQGNVLGTVEVLNSSGQLYLLAEMDHGRVLDQLKVFFGTSASIPLDNAGDMQMEDFSYQALIDGGTDKYTVIMPLQGLPACVDIVFWGQTSARDMWGNPTDTKQAWLSGVPIHNGHMFKYCVESCGVSASNFSGMNQ